jgi:ApaG protein
MSRPEFTCTVQVQPLPEQTDAEQDVYAYAYTVTINNTGNIAAQLVARHWVITDAKGRMEEVRGLAVVGHQPLLKPGESFEYTSWTRLGTPTGTMRGTYFCMTEDARPFEASIPEFLLGTPNTLH